MGYIIIMRHDVNKQKIIITGASAGIGQKLAWHTAISGGIPILLARSTDKLERIQQDIINEIHTNCFIYSVDITDEKALANTMEHIFADHGQIHAIINNAGMGIFEYVQDMNWQSMERMFQLNVLATMRLSQIMLNHFSTVRSGHIINIASQAAKIATPKSSVYAASKSAVIGFTNALRMEAASEGIYVTSVNLGPVRTNFFQTADPTGNYVKSVQAYMLDPDHVAKKVISYLFTNKREINMPWWMEFGSKLYQLSPRIMECLFRKQFSKK